MRAITAVIIFFAIPGIALAQGNRSGSWEWSFAALYQESKSMGSEGGSTLDVDDALGFGFNFGYNFTNHFTLGFDLDFIKPDYRAVLVDDMVRPAIKRAFLVLGAGCIPGLTARQTLWKWTPV